MTLYVLPWRGGTCAPASSARGAIVEKAVRTSKVIGDYLNSRKHFIPARPSSPASRLPQGSRQLLDVEHDGCFHRTTTGIEPMAVPVECRLGGDGALQAQDQRLAWRWRTASNRQTPVATETFRLLTLPDIGNLTRKSQCSRVSRRMPLPSAPMIITSGPVRSC